MALVYKSFLALAFSSFSLAAPGPSRIDSRVAGGKIAEPGQFPFIVAPQVNGDQWCAGTLLNNYTVLTAGHCSITVAAENATIRAGSTNWHSGGIVSKITEIKIHPSYRPVVGEHDIALWHLETPIQPSDTICYGEIVDQGYEPPAGLNAITAGWGWTAPGQSSGPDELNWVNIPVVSRDECSQYGSISTNMICAGGEEGKGSCPEDSGGPIFNAETYEVLGTVHSGGGCGEKGRPTIYTNLGTSSDWVRQNIWSA